jgi:hypothetical protein
MRRYDYVRKDGKKAESDKTLMPSMNRGLRIDWAKIDRRLLNRRRRIIESLHLCAVAGDKEIQGAVTN